MSPHEQFAKILQSHPDLHRTIKKKYDVARIIRKTNPDFDISHLLHDPVTTRGAPTQHFHYTICSSTQDLAKNHLMHQDKPAIFTADFQYAGYGRNGKWLGSIGQNILSSIIIPKHELNLPISLITSCLIRDYLQQYLTKKCDLKWPNDILLSGNKVAGVLAESSACNSFWIVGIGLNLHPDPVIENAPPKPFPATSVHLWTKQKVTRTSIIHAIAEKLLHLHDNIDTIEKNIFQNWCKYDYFYDKPTASKDQINIQGIGKGINRQGHYVIELPNKKRQPVMIGGIKAFEAKETGT